MSNTENGNDALSNTLEQLSLDVLDNTVGGNATPGTQAAVSTNNARITGNLYTVQAGDTFSSIAQRAHWKLADLEHANPMYANNQYNLINPGDGINLTRPHPTAPRGRMV
jgi:LysM repeat protein